MLYLDMMSQNGGQMYLDIRSVEAYGHHAAAISLQGILGDGQHEVDILVELLHGKISVAFLCHEFPFVVTNGSGRDFADCLRAELQMELHQVRCQGLNFSLSGGLEIAF